MVRVTKAVDELYRKRRKEELRSAVGRGLDPALDTDALCWAAEELADLVVALGAEPSNVLVAPYDPQSAALLGALLLKAAQLPGTPLPAHGACVGTYGERNLGRVTDAPRGVVVAYSTHAHTGMLRCARKMREEGCQVLGAVVLRHTSEAGATLWGREDAGPLWAVLSDA